MVKNNMNKVISKDGTEIAYDKQGQGPAVILIDGALSSRSFGPMPELAKLLSTNFTVIDYDRRGRGDSGDTKPFAVEREIEDIEALMNELGGSTYLYGVSSGACLAIEASIKLGKKVKKLASTRRHTNPARTPSKNGKNTTASSRSSWRRIAEGMQWRSLWRLSVYLPTKLMECVKRPCGKCLRLSAPTLLYDAAAMGVDRKVPIERVSHIVAPTLVMHGGAGLPFIKQTALTLSKAIPNAKFRTIEGQTHAVASEVIAPVLVEFFKS